MELSSTSAEHRPYTLFYHSPVRRIAVVVALAVRSCGCRRVGRRKPMAAALLLISDREPLAWLLTTGRFAVPSNRGASVPPVGSTLFVYMTRGCYRNPGRDRGRIIGIATVTEGVAHLAEPVEFRGRQFTEGFAVEIQGIAPYRRGGRARAARRPPPRATRRSHLECAASAIDRLPRLSRTRLRCANCSTHAHAPRAGDRRVPDRLPRAESRPVRPARTLRASLRVRSARPLQDTGSSRALVAAT